MPRYQYFCADNHETTDWRPVAARDHNTPACSACGKATIRGLRGGTSPTEKPRTGGIHLRGKVPDSAWHDFACDPCGTTDMREVNFAAGESTAGQTCPTCGGPLRVVFGAQIDRSSERFEGYYDDGLGCWIRSKAHRRQVMREKKVIEIGSHEEAQKYIEAGVAREEALDKEANDAYNADLDMYEHREDFRETYGKLKEEGRGGIRTDV